MLDLNDLRFFVQVVDKGGFAAAGRAYGAPKSTLSKRIAVLERAVGVRLIQRSSRSFGLTEIGREFYRHATAMVFEAEAAEALAAGRLAEPSGLVRVTAGLPLVQSVLARVLPGLALDYPKIQIDLHASDRFIDILQDGFDIAVRSHFTELTDSGLIQRRLRREEFWIVASPDFAAKNGPWLTPHDLTSAAAVMFPAAEPSWTLRSSTGQIVKVLPAARYFSNETTSLMEAAKQGVGLACIPSQFCFEEIAGGTLCRVLPTWQAGTVTVTLLTASRRGQLPAVRLVSDLIAKAFQD
ncbi:LysR substrate-binding domain-containing protein [Mesorhizobium sp.]|uniref:LysR substrate-binding domain-containing protein n=1 Tax=Mesorhizobium sp. TaxID=1871066 RepID=UPI00120CAB9C|nr:LysR substrate-binding domain-containing protein [Mesorhizobium sp.]TIX24896.1 MAG: LysR family transcriptional regulator [Mesorhizobium sp.]